MGTNLRMVLVHLWGFIVSVVVQCRFSSIHPRAQLTEAKHFLVECSHAIEQDQELQHS